MVKSDPLVVPDAVHAAAEPIGGHFIHPTSKTTRNAAVGLASGQRAASTTSTTGLRFIKNFHDYDAF